MIFLTVSYDQKEEAKGLGAKWEPTKKLWYAPDESYTKLIQQFGKLVPSAPRVTKQQYTPPSNTLVILGENRTYGGDELYVDLLPKGSSPILRFTIKETDFNTLRNLVVKRVAYKCEICDEECLAKDKRYLEVCERFSYDLKTNTQKLERILALCKECYSTVRVLDKVVCLGRLMEINDLDKDDGKQHISDAYELWQKRSETKWKPDLSIITNSGLSLKTVDSSSKKVTINKLNSDSSVSRMASTPTKNANTSQTKKITINKVDVKEECMIYDSD
jgi:hypothetical protein